MAMGREAMGQKGRKGQEREKGGQGSGGGGRRRTKGREARALGREGTLTQSPAPQGQCQCAQLRWLGDNYSSPGEKNTPSTHETGRSRPTAVSARRGTGARAPGVRKRGRAGPEQEMLMAQLGSFTHRSRNLSFIPPKFSMTEKENRIPPLKHTGFTLLF